jgi:D-aspartate ligase
MLIPETLKKHPVLILGMFETGLAIGRSLGREGIKVFGMDFRTDIGFFSRYINAQKCSHPFTHQNQLLDELKSFSKSQSEKPVLLISSDDFLKFYATCADYLKEYFLFNLSSPTLIEKIADKYDQFLLAKDAGLNLPATFKVSSNQELINISREINFPAFIKAVDVNKWRGIFGGSTKGFVVNDQDEMLNKLEAILDKNLEVIVQEIIPGPDTNHYKYCAYVGQDGLFLLEFTLRKIRQNPIHFGVGTVVESIEYPKLMEEGRKFFKGIGFKGVGSAEFKLDERDQNLKLIELNPRYWQQNSLPTFCGMNFPLMDYLEVTGAHPEPQIDFKKGRKWVNRYSDFDSFFKYYKKGELGFLEWRKSLRGKKIYSDFAWDDMVPFFYEFRFGLKFFRIPIYIFKKLTK